MLIFFEFSTSLYPTNMVAQPKCLFTQFCPLQVTGGLSSFSHATHSAAGAVVSKPREIASLIRNKFGSADNIAGLKDSLDETQGDECVGPGAARTLGAGQLQSSPKYGSEDDCSSATSGSAGAISATGAPGGPPSSKGNTLEHGQASGFDALLHAGRRRAQRAAVRRRGLRRQHR